MAYDWVSLGGGASGFFGAITFAELSKAAGLSPRVLILEATGEVLSKVRVSGGGRCNLTHHCFDQAELVKAYPRGSQELLSVFHRYQPKDFLKWIEGHGVSVKTEEDGRIFPTSDSSETVISTFTHVARKLGIEVQKNQPVIALEASPGAGFSLTTAHGRKFETSHLLVASGSSRKGWELLNRLGLEVIPPVPSLFSLNIKDARVTDLQGLSFEWARCDLKLGSEHFQSEGPLLITHWGLSGPCLLKLSAWAARALHAHDYRGEIMLDFLSDLSSQEVRRTFESSRQKSGSSLVKNAKPFPKIPNRFWTRLLKVGKIPEERVWGELRRDEEDFLSQELKSSVFIFSGKTTNKDEFVTAGGLSRREVDFRTMQVKKFPSLFVSGEVVDIDGITGGFNFQNAWSTAAIAARAVFESIEEIHRPKE